MLESRTAPAPRWTVAYSVSRKITLAPLACPHCAHEVRAADAGPHDDGGLLLLPCRNPRGRELAIERCLKG
jgi:hypothetical protein